LGKELENEGIGLYIIALNLVFTSDLFKKASTSHCSMEDTIPGPKTGILIHVKLYGKKTFHDPVFESSAYSASPRFMKT
jgi:hypothetical protein